MNRYLLLFSVLLFSFAAQAQTNPTTLSNSDDSKNRKKMLDDSTKEIYGPTTTHYFLEEDLFNNRKRLYTIDTSYVGFHRYENDKFKGKWYADLGSWTTALRPLYFEAPQQIGAQIGYDVYTPYGVKPYDVKYYDTQSPFTQAYYIQAGRGQHILHFDLSRNVNKHFNVGIQLERDFAQRQFGLGNVSSTADRQLGGHWNFLVHTNYRTKNDKYTVLAHYNIFEHIVRDQGGIYAAENQATVNWDSVFTNSLASQNEWAPTARSRERRNQLHVYHQYVPVQGFQLYHVFDYTSRYNRSRENDYSTTAADGFYNSFQTPSAGITIDTLEAVAFYHLLENKVGIKGAYKGFNYRLHLRRRDYYLSQWSKWRSASTLVSMADYDNDTTTVKFGTILTDQYFFQNTTRRANENFLGAWLGYYFKDSTRLEAEGEYLIGRDYRLHGTFYGKWFRASFTSTYNSPTMIQQRFISPLISWDNTFSNVLTNQVQASAPFTFRDFNIEPSIHYSITNNYIYFDSSSTVRQASSAISVYKAGLKFGWRIGKFSTTHEANFATTTGPDLIRMPKILTQSRVALDFVYSKVMYVQFGLDVHYRSSYYADFYQPVTNQFYLNDTYKVPGFVVFDAFADVRINRVRLFIQMKNLGAGVVTKTYMPTPYFPGLQRAFGFGVTWPLFN
ncbi:MAG: hypothetical protein QM669_06670 [Siphonobacter sp.]